MSLNQNFGDNIKDTCEHKNTMTVYPDPEGKGKTRYKFENIACKDCGKTLVDGKKEYDMKASREHKKKMKYKKELEVFSK